MGSESERVRPSGGKLLALAVKDEKVIWSGFGKMAWVSLLVLAKDLYESDVDFEGGLQTVRAR